VKQSESPAHTRSEGWWLAGFGVASWVYRLFLFASILLFVADQYLLLGLLMAAVCVVSWLLVPLGKFAHYLWTSPRLDRCRPRAMLAGVSLLLLIIAPLKFVPLPSHYRAPGVVTAVERTQVVNGAPGQVRRVLVGSSREVQAGQPLLELANAELELELAAAHAQLEEVDARILLARQEDPAAIQPLVAARLSVVQQLERLELDRERLVVRARHDGIWISPLARELTGRWLPRGTPVGVILDPASMVFTATVSQADADSLFAAHPPVSEVRLRGQAGTALPVTALEVIPADQNQLPSSALGQAAGGSIAVAADDASGRQAMEPFFEVRAHVARLGGVNLLHGRSGTIRFTPGHEPLLDQGWRRLRQLLQQRYQL
jgi:putative peptide zinc metalloprotease protein